MMNSEDRTEAMKALEKRTQEYLRFLSQAMGGYRGICEAMNAQLLRQDTRIEQLEAVNFDLLDVLKDMVYEGEGHVAAEVVERARDLIAKAEVT